MGVRVGGIGVAVGVDIAVGGIGVPGDVGVALGGTGANLGVADASL
jgi:hypothetical protein